MTLSLKIVATNMSAFVAFSDLLLLQTVITFTSVTRVRYLAHVLRHLHFTFATFYIPLVGGTRCFACDPLVKIQEGFKFEES